MKPKFNNRENKEYKTEDGPIWFSRSVAIVIVNFFRIDYDKWYVLAEKRSQYMDQAGKWCVACGYLDWDENAEEAISREMYEETGIHLPDLRVTYEDPYTKPFFVNSESDENRQNVTLCYSKLFDFSKDEFLTWKKLFIEYNNDEVDAVEFTSIADLAKYDWAFKHDKRIISAYVNVNKEL